MKKGEVLSIHTSDPDIVIDGVKVEKGMVLVLEEKGNAFDVKFAKAGNFPREYDALTDMEAIALGVMAMIQAVAQNRITPRQLSNGMLKFWDELQGVNYDVDDDDEDDLA